MQDRNYSIFGATRTLLCRLTTAFLLGCYACIILVLPLLSQMNVSALPESEVVAKAAPSCTGMACSIAAGQEKRACCCTSDAQQSKTSYPRTIGADCDFSQGFSLSGPRGTWSVAPVIHIVDMVVFEQDPEPVSSKTLFSSFHPNDLDKVPIFHTV